MVSIKGCSSKHPLPQPLNDDVERQQDSKTPAVDQNAVNENQVHVILAKSVVAAKMQIVSGIGNTGKTQPRPEASSEKPEVPGRISMKQRGCNQNIMIRNLKAIVADDVRWELFAIGALGLQPGTEACDTLQNCLRKGFKENTWGGIANLISKYSLSDSNDKKIDTFAQSDDFSTGLIERTKLWLTFTDYFETLFSAVKEKNLACNIDLYTDDLLIKYLDTIGQ